MTVTRETTKDSDDEDAEETTTVSYKLDGADLDDTTFTTFYNKLINMTAQQRLTQNYTPEGDPAYTFVFKDTDGNETTAEYYEYDTNFYAAVVGDKVYLVNKMNIRDMDDAYQEVLNVDTDAEARRNCHSDERQKHQKIKQSFKQHFIQKYPEPGRTVTAPDIFSGILHFPE